MEHSIRRASPHMQSRTTIISRPFHPWRIFLEDLWNTPQARCTTIIPRPNTRPISKTHTLRRVMLQAAITILIRAQYQKYSHLKQLLDQVSQQTLVDDHPAQTARTMLAATALEPQVLAPMWLMLPVLRVQDRTSPTVAQGLQAPDQIWLMEDPALQALVPTQLTVLEVRVRVPTQLTVLEAGVRVPALRTQPTVRGQPAQALTMRTVAAQVLVQTTLVSIEFIYMNTARHISIL